MTKKYTWKAPGTAEPAEPMKLGVRATRKLDRWLVDTYADLVKPKTATYLANGAAQYLGIGVPPLEYEVLHPLCATIRERCAVLGLPIRTLVRDDEGSQPKSGGMNRVKPRLRKCTACGVEFVDTTGLRKRCNKCRDQHKRRMQPLRNCEYCGNEYRPRVPNTKYCSTSCARKAQTERNRAKKAAMLANSAEQNQNENK